ncbi:MFS transporter [Variovorax sp. EL159]|uniref:MFS transporter n=1 Tax=Variovorax sp. EL159 TaxID=1566270 RepID=UPI00089274E8|nr:MFS transporter [Variovorax sp. EL159]SCX46242.1 drug resistance transporter, EmrB/QacA subfamily [Variovorax sp. EL159]
MSYRKKVAALYLLGFFVDLVNMFIANVAYPDIARAFDASIATLAWVGNAYILGLTLVIPLSGWLARRHGSKNIFMLSLAVFMLATLGAGTADTISALIAWRFVQGLGGGLLIPLGQTMAYRLYRPDERAGLSSLIMLVGLLAPALSPALGGLVVDALSWRWIFFLTVPLAALTLLLAWHWLRPEPASAVRTPLDLAGLASGALAIALALLGLTMLGEQAHHAMGAVLLAAGLLVFAWHVRGALRNAHPILDLRLVRDPLLRVSMLVYLLVPGVFMGVSLIAMFCLQTVMGMSPSHTGLLMLPWSLGAFLGISLTGKNFNRVGPRPLFLSGALLHGAGIALLAGVSQPLQWPLLMAAYTLMGLGGSLTSSAAQSTAFLQTADAQLGEASALWNIGRQISFCFGVALLSVLLNLLLGLNGIADPGDPAMSARTTHVFHLCFAIAAASAVLPILLCMRIGNADILRRLRMQSHLKTQP